MSFFFGKTIFSGRLEKENMVFRAVSWLNRKGEEGPFSKEGLEEKEGAWWQLNELLVLLRDQKSLSFCEFQNLYLVFIRPITNNYIKVNPSMINKILRIDFRMCRKSPFVAAGKA